MDAATTTPSPWGATYSSPRVSSSPLLLRSRRSDFWRSSATNWALIVFVAVVGAIADFWSLGSASLWYDETVSVGLARQSSWLLWHYIWGSEPNMELYYLLLHDWINVLGILHIQPTEFMLRLPSALCGALGAVVLYQLGNRFFGGRFVGLLAALLYVFNQGQIAAAQQVRSYSMEIFFCCLLVYIFLEAVLNTNGPEHSRRSRVIWWGAFVVVAGLVPYVHLFSSLFLLSLGVAFLLLLVVPGQWRSAVRQSFWWGAGSFALIVLAMIPAVWVSRHGGNNQWIGPASGQTVIGWLQGLTNYEGALRALSAVILIVGLLTSLTHWGLALRGKVSFAQPGMLVLACWFLVTAGVAYAVTQPSFNLHLFYPRYLIIVGAAWWLGIAVSLDQLRQRSSLAAVAASLVVIVLSLSAVHVSVLVLAGVVVAGMALFGLYERYQRLVLALVFVALAVYGTPGYYSTVPHQDFRTPAQWLQAHYQKGDGIVCYPNYDCSVPMSYYLWAYPGPAQFDHDSPGDYVWSTGTNVLNASVAGVQTYAAEHDRIFFIKAPLINGTHSGSDIVAWLTQHYTLAGEYASTAGQSNPLTVTIQLYVKEPVGP